MGLKELAAKVDEYNIRLEEGKVEQIRPHHVEEVLEKLRNNIASLETEIAVAQSEDKKQRLEQKRAIARAHVERGEWLLKNLDVRPAR